MCCIYRCSYLDEAASYAPLLDQLSNCLKSAFASPPPKIQTVKPSIKPVSSTPETSLNQHQYVTATSADVIPSSIPLIPPQQPAHYQLAPSNQRSTMPVIQTNQIGAIPNGKVPSVSYGVPMSK